MDIDLIVYGSRTIYDHVSVFKKLDTYIATLVKRYGPSPITIVSGNARRGIDNVAVYYAITRHYSFILVNADWDNNGKAAGFIRNTEMLQYGNHAYGFWDGHSRGTEDTHNKVNDADWITGKLTKLPMSTPDIKEAWYKERRQWRDDFAMHWQEHWKKIEINDTTVIYKMLSTTTPEVNDGGS